jgi:hypothetical protein
LDVVRREALASESLRRPIDRDGARFVHGVRAYVNLAAHPERAREQ